MRRSRAQWLARAACVAAMALVACGCGPNPQFDYLQSQPENSLVYPGATLVDTKTYPKEGLAGAGVSVDREFRSSASTDDIVAWYRAELAKRNWTGGAALANPSTDVTISFSWSRPVLDLVVSFSAPVHSMTKYVVHMAAGSGYEVAAQVEALRATPEAALAPPGARPQGIGDFWTLGLPTKVDGGRRFRVYHTYVLDSTASDVERFYELELAARGWTSVTPPATDPNGIPPKRTWQKGPVKALLFVSKGYEFALEETLNGAGSPVAP